MHSRLFREGGSGVKAQAEGGGGGRGGQGELRGPCLAAGRVCTSLHSLGMSRCLGLCQACLPLLAL